MNTSLESSFWVMVILRTFGAVDPMPGMGPRKMPSPSAYVPSIIAWGVLDLGADMGYEEPASRFAWLIVLAAVVLGPFGKMLVKLTKSVSNIYGLPTSSGQATTGTSPSGPQGGYV